MEAIAVPGDPCVVAEQVALGVSAEEGHPGGQSVFDVWIQEERRLAGAAGGGDQSVDIVGIHQSLHVVLRSLAAQHQPLFFRKVFSLAPRLRCKGDEGISLADLFSGSPARCSVLAIADRFGFDAVERAAGVVGEYTDQQENGSCQYDKNNR